MSVASGLGNLTTSDGAYTGFGQEIKMSESISARIWDLFRICRGFVLYFDQHLVKGGLPVCSYAVEVSAMGIGNVCSDTNVSEVSLPKSIKGFNKHGGWT